MKFSNKNKIILGSIIGVLVGTLLSVSYAFFTYTRTGATNSQLVAGDIYMRYNESSTNINISNMMPTNTLPSNYFQFTVGGKNTTTDKDIWYDIKIKWGDSNGNKVRIDDSFLKFTLMEKKDNGEWTTPVNAENYLDFEDGFRIWVDKISKNQITDTTHTYRLYVWIDNSVVIGNNNQDYTIEEWNNLFASVKVDVTGDFTEKTLTTNPNCFTLSNKDDTNHTATISAYDVNCGGTDIIIPNVIDGYTITELGQSSFAAKNITNLVLPNNLLNIGQYAFAGNKFSKVIIPKSVQIINDGAFVQNKLTKLIIPNNVITIGSMAFNGNQISNLKIGNNVQTIGSNAFNKNKLTNVVIPNSVVTIGTAAFGTNNITSLILGNSLVTIDPGAFDGYINGEYGPNSITEVTIPASVTNMSCSAFANQGNGTITPQITYENPSFSCSN